MLFKKRSIKHPLCLEFIHIRLGYTHHNAVVVLRIDRCDRILRKIQIQFIGRIVLCVRIYWCLCLTGIRIVGSYLYSGRSIFTALHLGGKYEMVTQMIGIGLAILHLLSMDIELPVYLAAVRHLLIALIDLYLCINRFIDRLKRNISLQSSAAVAVIGDIVLVISTKIIIQGYLNLGISLFEATVIF